MGSSPTSGMENIMKLVDINFHKSCSLTSMNSLALEDQERLMELGFINGCDVCPLSRYGRSLIVEIHNAKIALDCKFAEQIDVAHMAELVDAPDLGSGSLQSGGSIPSVGTGELAERLLHQS